MSFESFNLWVLAGLAAVAAALWAGLRSYAALGRTRRIAHLALRTLTILALLAALSGVTVRETRLQEGNCVVCVMSETASRPELDFVEAVRAGAGAAARVKTAAWGGTGRTLAETLALVQGAIPPDASGRVVVLGGEEDMDAAAMASARRLARAGIAVDVRESPGPASNAPRIVAALPASAPRAGTPFELMVTLENPVEAAAELSLEVGDRKLPPVALGPFKGRRSVAVSDHAPEAGPHLYRMSLSAGADASELLLPVDVAPALSVLIVRDAETPIDDLRAALAAAGVDVAVKNSAELRPPVSPRAAEWNDYDAVVLVNVSSPDLGAPHGEALRRYVFDGGGLLMVGGPKSFGCGGYYRTEIERALPVYMDPLREPPVYALVVVFDKSWSMGDALVKDVHKVDLMRETAIAASTPLAPHDLFGLISFDSQPHVILELRKLSDRALVTGTISTLGAFGTTNFYRPLDKARELLKDAKATYKHVILLSDGRSTVPNLDYQKLVESMVKDRVTVSTVGVGVDCHRELLASVASWAKGMNYYCASADRIPQVLLEESNRMKEILTVEVPSPVKASAEHDVLAGIDLAKCPELLGFNRVRAKESADTLLTVSHKDEPLLCVWNYGTGRAAAFASDAEPRWSAGWLERWPGGYAKLWQQLAKSVARAPAASDPGVRVAAGEWGSRVSFEALDSWGAPVTGLDLYADVHSWRDGRWVAQSHALSESAPGVYRAALLSGPRPPCVIRIVQRWEAAGDRVLATRALAPRSGGDSPPRADRAAELAKAGGGRLNPDPAQVLEAPRAEITRPASVQGAMLLAALGLFLADVIVRRYDALARIFLRES